MKKAVSLCLVLAMLLSLCACGKKQDEPVETPPEDTGSVSVEEPRTSEDDVTTTPPVVEEPPVPELTPEQLLGRGYGVDTLRSVLLDMTYTVRESGVSTDTTCLYEQDMNYLHFVVNETLDAEENVVVPGSKTYFSYADHILYQFIDGSWVTEERLLYKTDVSRLLTVDFMSLVENPVLEDTGAVLRIDGVASPEFMNALLGCVYPDIEELEDDVEVNLYYNSNNHRLSSMSWYAEVDTTEYLITVTVQSINTVLVSLDLSDGEVKEVGAVVMCDTENGEELMSGSLFDGLEEITEEDLTKKLNKGELRGKEWDWITPEVIEAMNKYINNYSMEGFIRSVELPDFVDANTRAAALLICHMYGLDTDILWQNNFMRKYEIDKIHDWMDGLK